ncbi:MAG: ABC transporter ATP-binding protein, partial [Candidatus Omnitrophota bacterium]
MSTCRSETSGVPGSPVVLDLRGVSKKFDCAGRRISGARDPALWALKDVSFAVNKGETVGIIGRNGAGKTTLLNIIAQIMEPDEGRVNLNGRVLGLFNLGVGFQDELTGRENIFLNGALMGAKRADLEARLDGIVEFSELGGFIDMPLGTYSLGMRLRLGFAIVVHLDFDILVVDEVLAVGDTLFQNKCFERFMDFRRDGKTLVITAQHMEFIERLCDRVAVLDHGNLIAFGCAQDAVARYRLLLGSERFYVGSVPQSAVLVENTKKWADDPLEWGTRRGTREVVIENVFLANRWGIRVHSIRSGGYLRVKVRFRVKNIVKDPHFGVAFFRKDGVYCYGSNTAHDGYRISGLKTGRGSFTLRLDRVFLSPGEYRISVAIWDTGEVVAYDYHNGCYPFHVRGFHDAAPPLLRMPYITKPANGRLGGGSPVQFDSDVWRTGQKVSLYLSSRAFNDKMALIR